MIEIIITLSLVTLFLEKFSPKYWIPYLIKSIQILIMIIATSFSVPSIINDILNLSVPSTIVSICIFILIALEVEHFNIKRWIKEVLFVASFCLLLTSSVSVSLLLILCIQTLLMVTKKNTFLDFVLYFLYSSVFCLYFAELSTTFINISDRYIVYYTELAENIFPVLALLILPITLVVTWNKNRSSSVLPLIVSIMLMIKIKFALVENDLIVIWSMLFITLYSVINFKTYLESKNISSAINVLFNISLVPIFLNALMLNFEMALIALVISSILLYSVRMYNVSKFQSLMNYKTITIYATLFSLSAFPLSITGISFIDIVSSGKTNPAVLFMVVVNALISWIVFSFSFVRFRDTVSFNLFEASTRIQLFFAATLLAIFSLMFLNLPPELAGASQYYLLRNSFADCCSVLDSDNSFVFNITLILSLISFFLAFYGLSIFKYEKIWKYRFYFLKKINTTKIQTNSIRRGRINTTKVNGLEAINSIGQSSSYSVMIMVLLVFISLVIVLIE